MRQSLIIIWQCLDFMPEGSICIDFYKISSAPKIFIKKNMESLIQHFKFYAQGGIFIFGSTYTAVESPKGELGIFLSALNSTKPYRCKIRAPGFFHLQGINLMTKYHLLADVVTIIGTQDIVFGEIDR